jgi:hypothetical protein
MRVTIFCSPLHLRVSALKNPPRANQSRVIQTNPHQSRLRNPHFQPRLHPNPPTI